MITITIILYRKYKIDKNYKKNLKERKKSNVLDLKKVYENKFPDTTDGLIFIDEKPVDYDLLGRDEIIKQLFYSLTQCRTDKQYVIGLTGKWGSGKTTIINNVKKLIREDGVINKITIIDEFDPWIYESQHAMFLDMFDIILSKTGITFKTREIKRKINSISNTFFERNKMSNIKEIFVKDENKAIEEIKYMINTYLKNSNKRIVFIIDNIDRANKENILLLFKTVNSVLNFERTVYLLSFDKNRLKKIFKDSLSTDFEYIDKILQQEIKVPLIQGERIDEINLKVMQNILFRYGLTLEEINNIMHVLREYSQNIQDLRELKININSIFNSSFVSNNNLNRIDSFIIKYISLKSEEIYDAIRDKKEFFVSEDYDLFSNLISYDNEKFNEEAESFFQKLFNGKNAKYLNLMSISFPYVKLFNEHKDTDKIPEYRNVNLGVYDKTSYAISNKDARIYNAKFVDSYFTEKENDFLKINIKVKNFIKFINSEDKKREQITKRYEELFDLYPGKAQRFVMENLGFFINDVKSNKLKLAFIIYDKLKYNDKSFLWSGLNSQQRATIVLSDLLLNLDELDRKRFLNKIKNDFKSLRIFESILYWMDPKDQPDKKNNIECLDEFTKVYKDMINKIVENKINIYTKETYGFQNLHSLLKLEDIDIRKNMKLDQFNVYMFLADLVRQSSGSYGYKFFIKKEDVEKIVSFDELDIIVYSSKPKNDKEKFIFEVYKNIDFKNTKEDIGLIREEFYDYDVSI